MKSIKHCLKKREERREEWKDNGRGKHVQQTLHACMELPQGNLLVLLMYANLKVKVNYKRNICF
jgi:hypothetical protein